MEDIRLIEEAKNGSNISMEKLIDKHSGLIWSIAKRFMNRGTDADDLYQIGVIGFIKCIRRFDLSKNVKLSTYAVPLILGELRCYFRSDGMIKISRNIKENSIKLSKLMESKEGNMSLKEAAEILNLSYEEALLAYDSLNCVESLDYSIDERGKTSVADNLSFDENPEDNIIDRIELNRIIKSLDEKQKTIIRLRYFENKTQNYISEIIGVSQVQISRMEKKIIQEMRRKML